MKTIYFLRHAERDTTVKDDLAAPLTKEGQQKAQEFVKKFSALEVNLIYSSPALRAIQTVQPLAQHYHLPVQVHDILRERQIGQWVADFSAFTYKQWDDFTYALADGESLKQVQTRMLNFYAHLLNSSAQNIIVSGHGTSFAVLFNALIDNFGYQEWQAMTMPDAYKLEINGQTINSFSRF